jgi:hypothetical protein
MRADTMTAPLLLLIALTLMITNVEAVEQADAGSTQATDPPDAELLEFIAGFEAVDGAWIDPMHFYDTFEADNSAKENDHE